MDFERYNQDRWASTCMLSGLRIDAGQPVRLVVLDYDYAVDTGPHVVASPITHPVEGIYAGEGKTFIAPQVDDAEVELFSNCARVDVGKTDQPMRDGRASDSWVGLISEKIWDGLAELRGGFGQLTLGQMADHRQKEMFAALKEFTASETHGREFDESAMRNAWLQFRSPETGDYPELEDHLDPNAETEEGLQMMLRCARDSHLLWLVASTTGRALVPSSRLGWAKDDGIVGDFARLVRRKALHSVMA